MKKKMLIRTVATAVSLVAGSVMVATLLPIGSAGADPVSEAAADGDERMLEMRERFDAHRETGHREMGHREAGSHEKGDWTDQVGKHRARRAHFAGQVADFLDMDRHELGEALREGATLADLAGDRTDELVAELVATASERIEQAVAEGKLDRDRADEILAGAEERATARVNGERPGRRGGPSGVHRSMHRQAS